MEKYVLAWECKITGHTGRGETKFTKPVAEAICKRDNIELPDMRHWAEEA